MTANPPTQYATDANLAARQRLWSTAVREPSFDLFRWVLDLIGVTPGDPRRVLDVGCGNGAYERALGAAGHVGARVAIDLSPGMLERVTDADRVQADVQQLPLATDSFDVVLAPHMLYHVPDVVAAAHDMRRVLRAGGVMVAVTNGAANVAELWDVVKTASATTAPLVRPSDRHFSLEDGAVPLSLAFDEVVRVDCPPSALVVRDADLVADYVASVADHYEADVDRPWAEVVERARDLASSAITANGAFRLTSAVGAFVCR